MEKSKPLSETKYRGFKIREIFNRRSKRKEFKCRFQTNNKEFYLTDESLPNLKDILDEVLVRERRLKSDLPVLQYSPTVAELFDKRFLQITRPHQRVLAQRVFKTFLSLLPDNIKITALRRAHFQAYIDLRLSKSGVQTKRPITPQTVNRELTLINAAWRKSPDIFAALENFEPFKIPKAKVKRQRREMSVPAETFAKLINHLERDKISKETELQYFHRVRLAHILQFALETGFRRKEIAALKFSQYDAGNHSLRNIERFKTETRTPFFPLSEKAEEIINIRRELQQSAYIFSPNGLPVEANYRTLKTACEFLEIDYGRYSGFVIHDLRHQFASEIIQVTDIETAKSLTGHKGTEILTYLHTTEARQTDAMRKRGKLDYDKMLKEMFAAVKAGKIDEKTFVETLKKLLKN